MKMSPMMEHYLKTKEEYKEHIVFYRLGDFYEMFFDDAILVSKVLELTLTKRACGDNNYAPMCGVPFHAAQGYISNLVDKGYSVAICEQVEDPSTAQGIVKREVVKILTPGTAVLANYTDEKDNVYLGCVFSDGKDVGLSYCDISTGELNGTFITSVEENLNLIIDQLVTINCKEIIINEAFEQLLNSHQFKNYLTPHIKVKQDMFFNLQPSKDIIEAQLGASSLNQCIQENSDCLTCSLGGLLSYLLETQKQELNQINSCNFYKIGQSMTLDKATLRNLEITETLYEKKLQGSLLWVLDKCKTSMGSRLLKNWIKSPLNQVDKINLRLDAVEDLMNTPLLVNNLRETLGAIYDFQRLGTKIGARSANGKDLIALKSSLELLPQLKEELNTCSSSLLKELDNSIYALDEVYNLIDQAITEDPPITIREGGLIKDGFFEELDQLKDSIKDGKMWIANLENTERERTGIKKLKAGFNKVFGYYIEVPKSSTDEVPEDYIRKQTLVNNERYITPKLKEVESVVLNGEEKINKLEYRLFTDLREELIQYLPLIQKTSKAVATIDLLTSFAYVSQKNMYVKPIVDEGSEILIEKGRHPVVERTEVGGTFVANDTYLNKEDSSFMIITGPNMSGKSTYMRQNALIVLMAQCGCFVPCSFCKIGVVDKIFTRIGASDNLSQGQSTFYVEMSELSYILNSATNRSLIILDEIGRGTSTYDGLAIAWATVEYLCNEKWKVRTLFATHYHELTRLEEDIEGVKNLNVEVIEDDSKVIFLHRIISGFASQSYGIEVAKLAGVPKKLLTNASNRLALLESSEEEEKKLKKARKTLTTKVSEDTQLSMFTTPEKDKIFNKVKDIDINQLTPSQAIKIIEDLKGILDD